MCVLFYCFLYLFPIVWHRSYIIYIYSNARYINPYFIEGLEHFKSKNISTMCEEGINPLLYIPVVVVIINNW